MLYLEKFYPQFKSFTFQHQIYQIFGNNLESYVPNEKLKLILRKDRKYF